MAQTYLLYSTEGCHLCDIAAALLEDAGIAWQAIDIIDDDALLENYGTRIPVLRDAASGSELGWPFDAAQLIEFVRALR